MTKDASKTTTPKTVAQLTSQLKWRLQKAPTIDDVALLVREGIIDAKEAKDILFNEVKEQDKNEREKALEEQVKFLESVIEKLSTNRGWGWVNTYTYTPTYPVTYWYNSGSGLGTTYAVTGANSVNLTSNISNLNGLTSGSISTNSNSIN